MRNYPWVEKIETGEYLTKWNGYEPSILGCTSYSENIGIGEEKFFKCVDEYNGIGNVDWWITYELNKLSEEETEELLMICEYKTYIKNIIDEKLLVKLSSIFNCDRSGVHNLKHSGIIELCNILSKNYEKINWIHIDYGNDKRIKLRDESNPYKFLSFDDYKKKNKIKRIY